MKLTQVVALPGLDQDSAGVIHPMQYAGCSIQSVKLYSAKSEEDLASQGFDHGCR